LVDGAAWAERLPCRRWHQRKDPFFKARFVPREISIGRTVSMSLASPQIVLIASVFERGFPRESSRLRAVDRIRG